MFRSCLDCSSVYLEHRDVEKEEAKTVFCLISCWDNLTLELLIFSKLVFLLARSSQVEQDESALSARSHFGNLLTSFLVSFVCYFFISWIDACTFRVDVGDDSLHSFDVILFIGRCCSFRGFFRLDLCGCCLFISHCFIFGSISVFLTSFLIISIFLFPLLSAFFPFIAL